MQRRPKTILEIGAGYGRILKKIVEKFLDPEIAEKQTISQIEIVGIEICKAFRPFFETYKKGIIPELKQNHSPNQNNNTPYSILFDIIYDDFFETDRLEENYFHMILLPMNTLPSFSYSMLPKLFQTIHKYLREDGIWIFSTYKLPEQFDKQFDEQFDRKLERDRYSGELLVDLDNGHIATELFQLRTLRTHYGISVINYHAFNVLRRDYSLVERQLFRTIQEFIIPSHLEELIEQSGFKLEFKDNSSHSTVYGFTKY
ncbi:MAG: class I SAM-dependent methyltransferase [Candidatus Heimdallarchaeaceae archaeon]